MLPNDARSSIPVASRTDRGVSARGNAIVLSSALPEKALLRALNGLAPDIFFTTARPVADGFNPRRAEGRWYRYFERLDDRSIDVWRATARRFVRRLDVRSLGRGIPSGTPVWRDVSRVEIGESGSFLTIDIEAPSFVWGMVRRMIAAMRAVDSGALEPARLSKALDGDVRLTLPLAEPEPLVLWEVLYAAPWPDGEPPLNAGQRRFLEERESTAQLDAVLAKALDPSVGR